MSRVDVIEECCREILDKLAEEGSPADSRQYMMYFLSIQRKYTVRIYEEAVSRMESKGFLQQDSTLPMLWITDKGLEEVRERK